jgi:hypothetical protein
MEFYPRSTTTHECIWWVDLKLPSGFFLMPILEDDPTNINSSPLLGSETSVTTTSIIRSGHLPTPQLGIITEIERAIKTLARTQAVKERICEYIQQEVGTLIPFPSLRRCMFDGESSYEVIDQLLIGMCIPFSS